jgi:coenzyme PQQ precursor peptide PqqA
MFVSASNRTGREDGRCSESGLRPGFKKESQMAWKAPKIVEVRVGMEINMYMCATRK